MAATLLAGFGHVPILREIASFLIVEDSLQPAAAIVALGGQAPFRQIEAAKLYHAGWAPIVFIVREGASDESHALQELGITTLPEWELSRKFLSIGGFRRPRLLCRTPKLWAHLRNYKRFTMRSNPKMRRSFLSRPNTTPAAHA